MKIKNRNLLYQTVVKRALKYASPTLQDDKDIVMAAVGQNGLALEFASPGLKNDRVIVGTTMLQQSNLALQFASEELKNDKDFKKLLLLLHWAYNELVTGGTSVLLPGGAYLWRSSTPTSRKPSSYNVQPKCEAEFHRCGPWECLHRSPCE